MNLLEVLGKACAHHGALAARPSGLVLRVNHGGGIQRWWQDHWARWNANLLDVMADDWEFVPPAAAVELTAKLNGGNGATT